MVIKSSATQIVLLRSKTVNGYRGMKMWKLLPLRVENERIEVLKQFDKDLVEGSHTPHMCNFRKIYSATMVQLRQPSIASTPQNYIL